MHEPIALSVNCRFLDGNPSLTPQPHRGYLCIYDLRRAPVERGSISGCLTDGDALILREIFRMRSQQLFHLYLALTRFDCCGLVITPDATQKLRKIISGCFAIQTCWS